MTSPSELRSHLLAGQVISAHPLALTADRQLDERCQRALTRYYVAAGAGGIAVGVHTTQFAIRERGLYGPVLELASRTADEALAGNSRPLAKVAGLCGRTEQAIREAEVARRYGYQAGLLSLGAWRDADDEAVLAHCRAVAETIPVFGFYLQPAVGGRVFPYAFWRRFAEIENIVGIKMAPFNRYQTIDVVRAVAEAGRDDIALYTGNDDSIVVDLLTPWEFVVNGRPVRRHIVGGLLGHWAVWTRRAVELLQEVKAVRRDLTPGPFPAREREPEQPGPGRVSPDHQPSTTNHQPGFSPTWLTRAVQVTDANAAFFDAANGFAGCIAGIHEVLRRQGLLQGIWCLEEHEGLSPGQAAEIDRVYATYPEQNDDDFVAAHREEWLR